MNAICKLKEIFGGKPERAEEAARATELLADWKVQQAYPIEKYPLRDGTQFWLTQKLNGVRATYYGGQLISRSGKPFSGVVHITRELAACGSIVLDGELTLKDKTGISDNEAFRRANAILASGAPCKTEICFTVFDAVCIRDFESDESGATYAERRDCMDRLSVKLKGAEYVSVLPVLYSGSDTSVIDVFLEQMVREDKEGLVVNLNVPYRRTRHSGILKVKRFYTMDLPILRYEEGSGKHAGTLGAFVVDFDGNEVNVGTGFTAEQRHEYLRRGEEMIGRLVEVKYKEISHNKSGGASLQFPVFVRVRDDKTEVSYG